MPIHLRIMSVLLSVTLLPALVAAQGIPDDIPSTPGAEPGTPRQYDIEQLFSWEEILIIVGGGILLLGMVAFAVAIFVRRSMR